MRRFSSVEPPTASPQLLHPVLQAALSSLDVQLEEELTRYRRQRRGKPGRTPDRQLGRKPADRPLEMIAVGAIGGRTQPHQAAQPPASVTREQPVVALDPDPWQQDDQPEVTGAAMAALAIAPDQASADLDRDVVSSEASDLAAFSFAPNASAGLDSDHPTEPDDYFASSEELLRSLAEEEADLRRKQEPGLLESLLTPLGIGSLLLLLLSSATLGYVILNPSSLRLLGIEQGVSRNEPAPAATADAATSSSVPGLTTAPNLATEEFRDLDLGTLSTLPTGDTAAPSVAPATVAPTVAPSTAPSPVSDPGGIPATLQQQRSPSASTGQSSQASAPTQPRQSASQSASPRRTAPAAAPSARNTPRSTPSRSAPSRSAPPVATRPAPPAPVAQPTVQPAPPVVPDPAPSVAASSAPSATAVPPASTQTASSPSEYYYVTAPYNGDRSLEQARQSVGDAYVHNSEGGAQIRLGAFSSESGARELAQELEQQGIPAQVNEP